MNCLIVDDEPLAIQILQNYVNRIGFLNLVACCENALEAQRVLNSSRIDIVFIDINMPYISGLDFVRALANSPHIIFTTAYREYAIDAFEVNAVDYLLKPISFPRFLTAVNKCVPESSFNQRVDIGRPTKGLQIKHERYTINVALEEILFLESKNDHVVIHLKDKVYKYYTTLYKLLEELPSQMFVQIHRSYVVRIQAVTSFSSREVNIGFKSLPIGRTYKELVLSKLYFGGDSRSV